MHNQNQYPGEYSSQDDNGFSPLRRGKQKQIKLFDPVLHGLKLSVKGQKVLKCTNYIQNPQKNTFGLLKLLFKPIKHQKTLVAAIN